MLVHQRVSPFGGFLSHGATPMYGASPSGIVGRCHLGHLRPAQRWKTQRCFDVIFVTFYRIFSLGDLIWSCMFFQDFKGVLMIFRGVYMIIWFCGGIIHLVSSIKTGDKHGDPAWWCKMDTRWYWRAVCQLESITILKKGIHHRSKWGMASGAMWIYW